MFSVQASYSYIITTHMSAHAQNQITHLANIFFPQFWWLLLWSFPNLPSFFRPQDKDGNEDITRKLFVTVKLVWS